MRALAVEGYLWGPPSTSAERASLWAEPASPPERVNRPAPQEKPGSKFPDAGIRITGSSGVVLESAVRGGGPSSSALTVSPYECYWEIPKDLHPGEYDIEAAFDAGPFGGMLKATKTVVVQ